MSRWRRVEYEGVNYYDVGVNEDGSLWNPNGHTPETVRKVVAFADAERAARRSRAARKAAETKRRRREQKVYYAAQRLLEKRPLGPRENCYLCGRHISDAESVERAIGPECWQDVLRALEGGKKND